MATAAAAASAASDAVSTTDHPLSIDDDTVYLVPYRWWRGAQESMTEDLVRGVPYAATSASTSYSYYGIRIISNLLGSDLILHLRRSDDTWRREIGGEETVSSRSYALIRSDLWSQALKWHSSSNLVPKNGKKITSTGENSVDAYPLLLRISVTQETNMTVKISKKDNPVENYKRANKIFAVDSEPVHIWDFSGQTNLILMNEWNRLPHDCRQSDQEILLEVQVYAIPGKNNDEQSNKLNGFSRGFFSLSSGNIADMDFSNSPLGLTGLENLGNTCFMNSAIQCLAHTPELVDYFLGDYTRDINQQNPLGMKGEIALAFGELLRRLWKPDKTPVSPHRFKSKLAHFAPQFTGFNQHDSQELLAFLLDGLHEDLNRVKSKPYSEAKDSDGRPDAEVADEYWANHLARNDSIIVDNCQGQYKSTLVCPECNKVSTTFDPFMYLSLPLPSTAKRTMNVTVFSTDGSTTEPLLCTITIPKFGTFSDFIQALSLACSLRDDETLLVAEVYSCRIIQYLEDPSDSISLLRDGDRLAAYRLPKCCENSPLIVFMHQRIDENNGFCKMNLPPKAFGVPLVARLPENVDGPDLRDLYLNLLNPFLYTGPTVPTESELEGAESDGMDIEAGLEFYLADEKGQSQSQQSKIETGRTEESGNPFADVAKRVYVIARWKGEALERYNVALLSTLREIYKYEPFSKSSRPVESASLYSCLELFIKEEPLGPHDMWYCPCCKKHQQASKKLDLWRLPEILVIHLKRFSYSRYTKNKLETYIDFPIHDLDLSGYITHHISNNSDSDQSISCHYRLYAISNHYGNMGGGHYTAYVFHEGEKRWYDFDDRHVSPISEESIKTSAAYVLFYRRYKPRVKSDPTF